MLKSKIKLVQNPAQSTESVAAWLIVGEKPIDWIAEITRWPTDHHELRIIAIPKKRNTPESIRGVLVTGNVPSREHVSPRCIPFHRLDDLIYIPLGTRLCPNVSNSFLSDELNTSLTYAWAPVVGLIGVEANEILTLSDLLVWGADFEEDTGWHEDAGLAVISRLTSIHAESPPMDFDQMMQDMAEGIGSEAEDPKDILNAPTDQDQSSTQKQLQKLVGLGLVPAAMAAKLAAKGLGGLIQGLASMGPQSGSGPSHSPPTSRPSSSGAEGTFSEFINRLENWASSVMESVSEKMIRDRHKELSKLTDMLESNPDEGLKFALPLSSWGGSRGFAKPGSKLLKNFANFDLSRLFGGGMGGADVWDVPYDMQVELTRRYRELAQRELNLGRFRRAAYIYAHLLGDLSGAANALKLGNHFREAAVLYKDKLHNPRKAVECLFEGGLFFEAIELCEANRWWELAGDYYREINQESNAIRSYEKAVEEALEKKQIVIAARIQELKINDADLALETLESAWPDSDSVKQCMREIFRILEKGSRHRQVNQWYDRFVEQVAVSDLDESVIDLVVGHAKSYPEPNTRDRAFDSAQLCIGRMLKRLESFDDPAQRNRLLASYTRLDSSDRLLRQDCQRYRTRQMEKQKHGKKALRLAEVGRTNKNSKIDLVRQFRLPGSAEWRLAIGNKEDLLVLGLDYTNVKPVLARSEWQSGNSKLVQLETPGNQFLAALSPGPSECFAPILRMTGPDKNQHVALSGQALGVMPTQRIHGPGNLAPCTFGWAPGWSHDVIATTLGALGRWIHLRLVDGAGVLDVFDSDGNMIHSRSGEDLQLSQPPRTASVYSNNAKLYATIDNRLFVMSKVRQWDAIEYDELIYDMVGTPEATLRRIALVFEYGVKVFWDGFDSFQTQKIGADLAMPRTLFTRTGHLVLMSGSQIEIYSSRNRKLLHVANLDLAKHGIVNPVSLVTTKMAHQFGVVAQSGQVVIYQIPAGS